MECIKLEPFHSRKKKKKKKTAKRSKVPKKDPKGRPKIGGHELTREEDPCASASFIRVK